MTAEARFEELAAFLWSTADMLLRPGGIEQEHYGRVILPFTVLRRLDCVLEPTRQAVWTKYEQLKRAQIENVEKSLRLAAGVAFYNTSRYDFRRLIEDPDNLTGNFTAWVGGFSPGVELVLERFGFAEVRKTVEGKGMLYKLLKHFSSVDLHPDRVPNAAMGSIFEELVRRFSDNIDENAGQYFTPREVVDLMADLVVLPDGKRLALPGTVRTVYDPCCGTGGMLFGARGRIEAMNRAAEIHVYGQENAARIWAVCAADLMIASRDGRDVDNIKHGSTLSDDQHAGEHFDYLLANPPYGYHWEEFDGAKVREEFRKGGRFVGLPRKTDGQMLFLQHMVDKMRPATEGREGLDNGARMAIVMGGSPLFAGDAGSGESEVRRWIFEKDYCEAIIALPEQLFFNTGIGTYVWVLTNRKEPRRRGKVQLIDATDLWELMPRSLGYKRRELLHAHIEKIKRLYLDMVDGERSRVLDPLELGYRRLRVERPLRLRLEVDAAGTARLEAEPAWVKFSQKEHDSAVRIRRALDRLRGRIYMDRALFREGLAQASREEQVSVTAPVRKVIEGAFGESDEAAAVCLDAKGKPEPDPSLRGQSEETAPLTETNLEGWFEREVKPHVPDAWLDTEQWERTWRWRDEADDVKNPERPGRVGYEVNFNRYFFKYEPPRALEEIDRKLAAAEAALQAAMRERRDALAVRTLQGAFLSVEQKRQRRPSGIAWMDDIPAHWEVTKIRHVARMESGHTPSRSNKEYWQDCTIPWVSLADVRQFRGGQIDEIFETEERISELGLANSAARLLPKGTVILSRTASVGFSVMLGCAMATTQDFVNWVCGPRLLPRYLLACFRAMGDEFRRLRQGSVHNTIYMPDAAGLEIPLPPIEEQQVIVQHIAAETARIDATVGAATEVIALLGMRRAALNHSAVAGAIDVRDADSVRPPSSNVA